MSSMLQGWTHSWRLMSRDKADTLLLLLACCLVLAPHASHVAPWVTAAALAMLIWRGWITFRGNRMPPRWILAPIALLTLPGVYWTYQTFFGRDAGVAMLVLLLTCKLLEMRAKRDLFVVVCLSFFLMLTNLFYSQSISSALLMLAATLAILTSQLSFQYTGVIPPLRQRLRFAASIVGMAAPLMLVLFLLFPRIQGPLWGMPTDAQAGRSGMSETMAPGNIASLALSEEIAFRVKFIDPMPARTALYWRGLVLGNYDGRTWSKLHEQRTGQPITIVPKSAPIRYRITMEPSNQRWLYALDVPQRPPYTDDNPTSVGTGLQFMTSRPITDRIRYALASVIDFELQPDADQIGLQDWLDLPPGFNPRTHAYAASLRNQSDDTAVLIQTVLALFRNEPFRYTLEPPLLARDAVDDFLFNTRSGFCEHYASAFVVLMRALDIPARVVTGYQGGELNPVDQFLTVRQSDAHAWTEVWLRGRGWVRIDPTAAVAPERIERNGSVAPRQSRFGGLMRLDLRENPLLAAMRMRMDAMNNGWNQWVLNYSFERQKTLLQSLGFARVDWGTLAVLMVIIGSTVMLVIAVPLLWKRDSRDPFERVYLRLCALMARRGMARAPHEGPRSYGLRLTAPNSPVPFRKQETIDRFITLYETARYGRESDAGERRQLLRQLTSLLAKIK